MSVKVLLLWPGTDGAAAGNFGCPQLVTLASYLRQTTGALVTIVDLHAERVLGPVDLRAVFKGPHGTGYDVVGFSVYSSFDFLKLEAIATVARTLLPDATFVAGGYHVSARPTDFMGEGSPFDVAVVGEGEHGLRKVVEAVQSGAPLRQTILSSDPVQDLAELAPSDWRFLDPRAESILVRQFSYDWGNERDGRFAIERLDRPALKPRLTAAEIGAKLDLLLGDCTKANKQLGWTPKVTFQGLVNITGSSAANS